MTQIELWQHEAKKIGGESLVQVIMEIRDDIIRILKRLDEMDDQHKEAKDSINKLTAAFVGGDVEGHRRFHEMMIERNKELKSLRIAIQEKTISALLWSAIMFVAMAVFQSAKSYFK